MNFYDVIFAQQKTKADSKYFGEISDAINVLAGTEKTYNPAEMGAAIIDAIPNVTVTDSIVSVTDAAAYPAEGLEFAIEPVQEGSGDPSPTNIRPISGWTGVNGKHSGTDTTQYTEIPITFPAAAGTVYGGKVDVVNGKLTVNYASVDLGTMNWKRDTTTRPADGATIHAFYATLNDCKTVGQSTIPKMMSSSFTADFVVAVDYGGYGIIKDNICSGADSNHRVWIYGSIYNDLSPADFKAAMQGVQLVYELAEPIEYDITPQEVQMLLGDNNVWCDTGDTTLEYKVDLGRYIAKLQAAQAAPQLSLLRQAVSLDAVGDVEPITQEIKSDVSERKSAETEEQEKGGDAG